VAFDPGEMNPSTDKTPGDWMRFEEENSGWRRIERDRSIDLGEYRTIKGSEDWRKGTHKALQTILERIQAPEDAKRRAEELLERVDENQAEFSGNSRLSIASAIVYFASEGDVSKKRIAKEGSISKASLQNMTRQMSDVIDLN